MDKDADAYRTISEVAQALDIPPHVLRFWETRFPQIKPLKRGGGRRYYRRGDTDLLRMIRRLLYEEGYTIRGVQRLLKSRGGGAAPPVASEPSPADEVETAGATADPGTGSGAPKGLRAAMVELSAEIARCRMMLDVALHSGGGPPDAPPVP